MREILSILISGAALVIKLLMWVGFFGDYYSDGTNEFVTSDYESVCSPGTNFNSFGFGPHL